MSGAQEVVCEGWLRKSPPEKKLRRYAWKKRWFVLRSGRLSGEPDVLQYYKSQHSRRPIRTINLNLCEQVDAGLSFTKKELESSFVFDLKTEERTWYLVAESEEDMNRWVTSICLLCGFNQTHDAPKRPPTSITSTTPTSGNAAVTMETGLVPPPYDPVRVNPDSNAEEDYLLLSHCQSHNRPTSGSSISVDTDYNDNPHLSAVSSSSSSSSSPSLLPNSLPPPPFSSGFKTAPWSAAAMTGTFSQSLDTCLTSDLQTHPRRPRCHPSPHPRKHSLDFHLRPVPITLSDDAPPISGYQIPRPVSSLQPRPLRRPSSTPSVELLTQAELNASTPTPPPRPPKPQTFAAQGDISAVVSLSPGRRDGWVEGGDGGLMKSNVIITPAHTQTGCDSVSITHSRSDRASMFEFSESFSSYFFNKGLVPLGSICSEEDDVDENYVPMSAATTEPPAVQREPAPPPADASVQLEGLNYVPMTPSQPAKPSSAIADQASLGKQVPPPAHMGFRNSPLTPLTSPVQRNTMTTEATPPPVHRNLKPQHKGGLISESGDRSKEPTHRTRVKPAPLDINPVQQDWQEVPPPVRSPVTRTFTRHPSCQRSIRPTSDHSSSPASDSDDPDESYITMTTSSPNFSAGEPSLRLMLHRASEGGVSSSPMPWRARDDKQVEYLDLDLHTGRSTSRRQKCCKTEGGNSGCEQADTDEECSRGGRSRVDYVVVDPKRTKALRNTREAWHDGRMSTEKEKC